MYTITGCLYFYLGWFSEPVIKVPSEVTSGYSFLPDPKDGSLYALSDGMNGIKKLPLTIPELVTASPYKSKEGILYTGKNTI